MRLIRTIHEVRHPDPLGRGTDENPATRFQLFHKDPEPDWDPAEDGLPRTQVLEDRSESILSYNNSPDVGFEVGINPYRGCEHGCIYCYARPTHEYLGYSAGLDFETRILVKRRAPELLRKELSSKRYEPKVLAMSGVTDCYQPLERKYELTRSCLKVLAEFRNPVVIITKNALITRDVDVLKELSSYNAVAVWMTVTTLDLELKKRLEPRTTRPEVRLKAVSELAKNGIPVGVLVSPMIPAINDHEIPTILKAAGEAGARFASMTVLRLPGAVGGLFEGWLERHYPQRKDKVLNQLRSMRGGKLHESQFGLRMRGEGVKADQVADLFHVACRKAGVDGDFPKLNTEAFRRGMVAGQMELF